MAVSEQIGGVQLSTYGLRLARLDGNLDLPPFKKVLDEHNFESNLLVLDEKTVKIRLIGFYASKPALGTAIQSFYTKIQSAVKQVWIFSNHGFSETCVVNDGVSCSTYKTAVEIVITLTITAA